ncbi:tripartite tricarboxylate transporter substrate binding protein [Luteococcus sp. OSA5]|uniref:tripartite tricarboxylate transporter substrate binding protein n=1 Tax=Luteococcus sp. OSA5 TaxID=3401630 RepID=UPI003B4338D8
MTLASLLALSACGGSGSDSSSGAGDKFNPGNRLTMIVPMSAGGGSDIAGRAIAKGFEGVTKKTISVENKPGGGGAVGYGAFMGNKGSASHLLSTETALVNLPLTQKVPFTWRSFTPIMKVGQDSTIVVVPTASKYKTCKEVVDAAKSGAVRVSVSGGATGNDAIQFSLIEKDQGVKFQRVPYESGGEAIAAVLGGHVDVALANPGEVMGQLDAKEVRGLCMIGEERYTYDKLKDIPTTVEQGINVTFAQFRGVIAPGDIKPEAKDYWVAKAKEYAASTSFEEYMEKNYMQTDPKFGDDFANYLETYEQELKKGLGK